MQSLGAFKRFLSIMKMDKFDIFKMIFICCFGLRDTAVYLFPTDQAQHTQKHETDTSVRSH